MRLALAGSLADVTLGRELGRGGEGAVYAVEGHDEWVAKCYASPASPVQVRKLNTMAGAATPELLSVAAWPSGLLSDGDGQVRGFVMARAGAKSDIHQLYSPRSRSEVFPGSDFRLLVTVATNVARAFGLVHAQGHVVGDINHGNILVGPEGDVVLIDCDSFQVANGAEVFTCDVGVPLFTPPELQGQPLRGVLRSENHDRFGLAVLLFHLLYMGRHPFAGRYSGPEEMPIEKAIAEYRFAYGRHRAALGMQRPPGSLALETMGPGIAQLFQQAFSPVGATHGRPAPPAWVGELEALGTRLVECERASGHVYPDRLALCPWCAVEIKTGAQLFGQRVAGSRYLGPVDLASLLRDIAGIQGPGPDPPMPPERTRMRRLAPRFDDPGRRRNRRQAKHSHEYGALRAAESQWLRTLELWRQEAAAEVFDAKRRDLEAAVAELSALPQERLRRLKQLDREHKVRQLRRHLNQFSVEQATIHGIGPSRTAMLASYGIETAADVTRRKVSQVPGIDSALAASLMRWRRGHREAFVYDPTAPVDRRDIAEIDRALEARRQELMALVRQGPDLLRVIASEVSVAREAIMPELEASWSSLLSALERKRSMPELR